MPNDWSLADRIRLQQALLDAGYDVGPTGADGVLGQHTKDALIAFQQDNGLDADGVVNAKTVRLLFPTRRNIMDSVLAEVKSAWLSKINWTVAVGIVFNVLMYFGHPVPEDVQSSVYTVGNGIVLIVTYIMRTWFTTSITKPAAKKV